MFALTEWHHGTLRLSLINAFYYSSRHQMEEILRKKADRKTGIQYSFKKQVIKDYASWDKNQSNSPMQGPIWNIASGLWEPDSKRTDMVAAHIVPQMLGKSLLKKIFGKSHGFHDLYGSRNALLLPKGLAYAFDEWAITVVPDIPENPTISERKIWVSSTPKEYKFRVLDPEHEELQTSISGREEYKRLGRDLDQVRVRFNEMSDFRPSAKYLYFGHCCAVMARHHLLFRDEVPVADLGSIGKKRIEKLLLKREMESMEKKALFSRTEFWKRMVGDLEAINEDEEFLLDWSMDLKETAVEESKETEIQKKSDGEIGKQLCPE